MFRDTSRYAKVTQEDATTADGRTVTAIRLRRLPPTAGDSYEPTDLDRLDLLAQARYADGTKFWHIADANTVLDAQDLCAGDREPLDVPKS